ncbi:MAG: 4-hydroxybenzoate octaprenyltransferase [Elusimicrobia bacterium]|nr:4-hydroxybenzoate octaprenyltransferase [Elusimicrobiota bacterium]
MSDAVALPSIPTGRARLAAYARFVKLEHALFSLPITFSGRCWPRAGGLLAAVDVGDPGGVAARTFAMAVNRIIDVQVDAKNPRTKNRELVTGALSVWDALLVAIAGLVVYIWCAQSINSFCLIWSWVPLLFFVIYPTLKRFTWLCHFGLGLTWALAPLGGWFAVRPGFEGSWPAWILGAFSFFWLSGFDIIYGTLDEEFDRREGLFSLPARFGRRRALRGVHDGPLYRFSLSGPALFTSLQGANAAFMCLGAGALLFVEQLVVDHVDLAFFKINVITGFVVLVMVVLGLRPEF